MLGPGLTGTAGNPLFVQVRLDHFRVSPFPGRALLEMQAGGLKLQNSSLRREIPFLPKILAIRPMYLNLWRRAPSCALPLSE